ncbi:MAG: O-antigen ligase family protein, partial [Novosphingobium sp.]
LSIDSEATWHTFAFLIPFLGAYLAYRSGTAQRRAALMQGVALGLAIAVALGLLQALGLDFLHPFPIEADNQFGNGFFTNHNHQATFVIMGALLIICHLRLPQGGLLDAKLAGLAVAAILAAIASGSRAGFVLMLAAALAFVALWFVTRARPPGTAGPSRRPLALALGGAALVAATVSAMVIGADRFALGRSGLLEDQRLEISPIAWQAIWQFWPFGSGFGTFQTPYRQVEPIEALRILDVTHAHNDLLEVAIEGGALGLALVLCLSIRILVLTGRGLRQKGADGLRIATLGLVLAVPLVHSLVDYPLRTMAMAVLFAVALASLESRAAETHVTNA